MPDQITGPHGAKRLQKKNSHLWRKNTFTQSPDESGNKEGTKLPSRLRYPIVKKTATKKKVAEYCLIEQYFQLARRLMIDSLVFPFNYCNKYANYFSFVQSPAF
jgi:hypothetical protein